MELDFNGTEFEFELKFHSIWDNNSDGNSNRIGNEFGTDMELVFEMKPEFEIDLIMKLNGIRIVI